MTNTSTRTSAPRPPRTWSRSLVLGVAALALAGTLVACSSSSGSASPAPSTQAAAPNGAAGGATGGGTSGGGGGAAGGIRPAAYGSIAALSAGTMQVQSTTAQTTVRYTSSTTFTETLKKTLGDVKVGSCVTAAATPATATAPAAGAAQTTPTSRPAVTALTAATVLISLPVAGVCNAGFGGGFSGVTGTRPGGQVGANGGGAGGGGAANGGAVPSGAPGVGGTGTGRGNFAGIGERASGKVTSVSGSTIVVQQTNRTTKATSEVTVTVDSSTAYTETAAARSTALKIGLCAVAVGSADSTGAVAAKSIALSPASATGCTSGFGAGGFSGRTGRGSNGAAVTTSG
jgi:hypothetical protein